MLKIVIVFTIANSFIFGCANLAIEKNYKIDQYSKKGIVVLSLDQPFHTIKWSYRNVEDKRGTPGLSDRFISTTAIFQNLPMNDGVFVYPIELENGKFEFFTWNNPGKSVGYRSTRYFSVKFNVEPGKVTYIGRLRMAILGESKYSLYVTDERESDIPVFKSFYTGLSNENILYDLMQFHGFNK